MSDGEYQLESTLHKVDLLDAQIYPFQKAPGDPVSLCATRNKDVAAQKLAFRLSLGKPQAQDKAAEVSYYDLLAEGSPTELIPIVHLRRHYKEGLLKCLLNSTNSTPQAAAHESDIAILTAMDFDAETSGGIFIIDFMAHWCGPCKVMVPALEKLARDYRGKLRIGRLNVDRNRSVSERFGINEFPTLMILKNGKEVARLGKASSYEELREWAEGVLQGERRNPERAQE